MTKVRNLRMTCPACPSQWEGRTPDNQHLYIRFRWGKLQIWLEGIEIFTFQPDPQDTLRGVMSLRELQLCTHDILDFSEARL